MRTKMLNYRIGQPHVFTIFLRQAFFAHTSFFEKGYEITESKREREKMKKASEIGCGNHVLLLLLLLWTARKEQEQKAKQKKGLALANRLLP